MSEILRLDYACTRAELEEAQSLSLRKQIGGGSKHLTTVILFIFLLGAFFLLYLQIRMMVSAPWRPYVYAATAIFLAGFVWWRRRSRKEPTSATTIEVSEKEVTIVAPTARIVSPWSSFSQLLESPTLFVLVDRTKSTLLVLPKRVFPDEGRQTWFCELASHRAGSAGPPPMESPVIPRSTSKNRVTVHFQLRYRDFLDRTLASWRTWGVFLFMATVLFGTTLYSAVNPPPDVVYSAVQVLFLFELPFVLVMLAVLIPIVSLYAWRSHAKVLTPQQVAFTEDSIEFASSDGSGDLPWTIYSRYKETPWSFILWRSQVSWLLVPKRTFASPDDLERFRALLARRLQRSRWFFG